MKKVETVICAYFHFLFFPKKTFVYPNVESFIFHFSKKNFGETENWEMYLICTDFALQFRFQK
jgi:hypothetical protein